ncbi:UDP-N-acetylglucosamine--dolichyl-phosphate N-acetylglucosaminephosphotransferase [Neodiprion pinetum]|uniref:UDP-N-acetylglucosamine--dolichyl-phosphate N-acetylglucosaminephosphotransferase n=1 Tax=Neodiprion lecontei TaxID=441921 RepID=A0A6J0B8I2_NEOLC|nr:UDP-N-acetylglucosamine--dolichyl-phosphate N-acetylglucosaminephosphotransferase [Neodiprion lecontei]XP_046416900.1 UDP-N-acetylglucosamine--dolichyl-phosphate N-acetylglucosaminephosphotransferase [Neodiprion fabricii]XP_046472769.1 UDP-N-acetylglucosamine--dolichyl-phosphate N-acetylglucosaminephosphotransferase [Neodiprion pinetum]XP_046610685.1 UDP-N-acetylglucosamine--dolichyl-phosphate N-acetylglucosaminephosphotransferase [Neodiprion virginianus]
MEDREVLSKMNYPIYANVLMSVVSYFLTVRLIPKFRDMFIKGNLYGIDMNKKDGGKVPEALGVVTGCVFLITMFLFIPVPFTDYIFKNADFPHNEFVEMLAALLSICCMLLLGFADDVLDLRWRHKLLLPTIASLPLLMVYYVNFNSTLIIVPKPLRPWFGLSVDLWLLYYVYMGMLAVFCTNAINILAGVNGLEVGQSLVIAASISIFNLVELSGNVWKAHQFSLYFMLPYMATSLALFKHNWYPSQVFVGDTFCYLSGMTFAVVGILGHFSKTILLFFIPQIINFLYSIPQLFHLVPCPRHRLPRYNKETDKLDISVTVFKKSELNVLAKLCLWVFRTLKIVSWKEDKTGLVTCNNLTLINFILYMIGPTSEPSLTIILILIQIMSSVLAFMIRYPLASVFYDI